MESNVNQNIIVCQYPLTVTLLISNFLKSVPYHLLQGFVFLFDFTILYIIKYTLQHLFLGNYLQQIVKVYLLEVFNITRFNCIILYVGVDIPWDGGGAGNDVNSTYTVCSLGEVKKSKKIY